LSGHYRGILSDPGPSIWRGLLPSAVLHLPLLSLFVVADCDRKPPPRLDEDVFMVSAVVLPKAEALPKKAAAPKPRAAGESGQTKKEAPILDNEMVLKEKTEKKEGPKPVEKPKTVEKEEPKPKKRDLSALLNQVEEEADDVIFETSPDGDPNAKPTAGLQARFGRQLTPYERAVRDAVQHNWFPKSSRGEPPADAFGVITFELDDSGTIRNPRIEASSGDFVYDQSCLRAVQRTRRVEAPPADANRIISVGFSPKDKQG
jgi:TonB family protein